MSLEHVPRWFANTTVHFECLQLYCFKTKDVKDIVNFCSVRLCSDDVCSSAYVFLLSTKQITRNLQETHKNDLASASVSITRGWLVFVLQWVICSTKVPLKFRFGTTNNKSHQAGGTWWHANSIVRISLCSKWRLKLAKCSVLLSFCCWLNNLDLFLIVYPVLQLQKIDPSRT